MPSTRDVAEPGARNITVRVRHLQVDYRTRRREGGAGLRRIRHALRPATDVVQALRGVSFDTFAGQSVGVVGRNGSGKSTLLRCLAGLETPTTGSVRATSRPQLLGVSAALLPDLSGLQNIRLGGLAMGMSRDQVEEAVPDILALSDLGRAIHRPMRTYSSGMAARLRFSIAVAARPEILLIDEALSTGDATFADRSAERMKEVLHEAGTVMLVTHVGALVEELCTRAIWLHDGELLRDGKAAVVAEQYRWWAWNLAKGRTGDAAAILESNRLAARGD